MKYYALLVSSESKVIGVNNGVYQGNIKWEKFAKKGMEKKIMDYFSVKKHISNQPVIESIDFQIEFIEALKSAKMTDFFKYSPKLWGVNFFVTKKTKDIFIKFNLPSFTFIPANIYHNDKKYEYYGLYVASHYREDSFDFLKSLFYSGIPYSLTPKKYLSIKNIAEYKDFKGLISSEKLAYNNKFDFSLDLFDTLFGKVDYYVSEKFKVAIEEAGLTGVVIREPKEPELIFE